MRRITGEEIVSELVVNGGDARCKAIAAMQAARENRMDDAAKLMEECEEALNRAHNFQTDIIQASFADDGENMDNGNVSLLMIHGQDHLMDAMVVRDMAAEMIELYKIIYKN